MIFINEWLPNPAGLDAEGEWLELFNDEAIPVNLDGWVLVVQSGKSLTLSGNIPEGGYVLLNRLQTKLVLRNNDGGIALYDRTGSLVHESSFLGSAPEGKSFNRVADGDERLNFVFSDPTPGSPNVVAEAIVLRNTYPLGQPLNRQVGYAEFFGMLLGVAVVLTGLTFFILKRNENLSKLFFGGN